MNSLIENKDISEQACGTNFAYVLRDNADFLPTEYKVLQSQRSGCFVKCMKMLYNGKSMLYYMPEGKPLSAMLAALDADRFLTIVAHLFASIIEVQGNGFLRCQNIDLSFEKIYVDAATYQVSLVYLPLAKRLHTDDAGFENTIRTELVKLIDQIPALASEKTRQLSADLSDGTLSLREVYGRIKETRGEHRPEAVTAGSELRLLALNAPSRVELQVTKDAFVIGKKADRCDGVISFNKMISRCHCRIDKAGAGYTITDLESANGTYVNRVRLCPNQPHPIGNGDTVRLANSDFRVIVE